MAKLTFGLEELVKILISNELLPRKITRIRVKDDEVHFVIKTQSFILPFIPASLKYLRFENNCAIFELTLISGRADKIISMFDQALELKLPAYIKFEYPNIIVDIDKLFLENNIKSVRVENALFEDGRFTIVTGGN